MNDIATLRFSNTIYLINASLLVVVDPLDSVVWRHSSHRFREQFRIRHDEVVEDGDDVAGWGQRAGHLFVDPVPLFIIAVTTIKGT
jgi:hypothetical protein